MASVENNNLLIYPSLLLGREPKHSLSRIKRLSFDAFIEPQPTARASLSLRNIFVIRDINKRIDLENERAHLENLKTSFLEDYKLLDTQRKAVKALPLLNNLMFYGRNSEDPIEDTNEVAFLISSLEEYEISISNFLTKYENVNEISEYLKRIKQKLSEIKFNDPIQKLKIEHNAGLVNKHKKLEDIISYILLVNNEVIYIHSYPDTAVFSKIN